MSNPSDQTLFRLRVAYPKLGRLKYLGHLEVIHTVERVVRRARLPYAVTQGFSPHMRIAYTSALPVGTSSVSEYFDVYLTELVPAASALSRLHDASPIELRPMAASYVELRRPALTAEINRVRYLIELVFADGFSADERAVGGIFDGWLDRGIEIPYVRGKKLKRLDIRQTLRAVSHELTADGRAWVELATHCDNEGSLRPEILIAAFDQALRGLDPGVDEQIVSTGTQRLATIGRYQVERISQRIATDGATEVSPLPAEPEPPKGSLLDRALAEALSNL